MEDAERSIRNAVVDILCFLSSGKATESKLLELEKLMSMAANAAHDSLIEEHA